MLAKLKTITDPKAREEFLARVDAWWDGRDFDPEALEKAQSEQSPAGAPPKLRPLADDKQLKTPPPRIGALETIWGKGRWTPSCGEIDGKLVEAIGRQRGRIGKLGLIGVDAIAADHMATAVGEELVIAEWRLPCAKRTAQIVDNAVVKSADLDRITCFADGSLKALLSVEAMTFVDHKGGLAARAYRSLREGGRWALLDYSIAPGFKPQASFASAWAEPQLQTDDQIRIHLETVGFRNIEFVDVTEAVLRAARSAFARLGAALEDATSAAGNNGRDGALMLQELSWEATSWKARIKALEADVLAVRIWTADKPGAGSMEEPTETSSVVENDASALSEIGAGESEAFDVDDEPVTDASGAEAAWDAPEEGEEEEALGQDDIDSLFD